MKLENKVALVTGASRGIGQAIAKELAKCGAIVIGSSTSKEGVKTIDSDLKLYNGWGVILDVTNEQACNKLIHGLNNENNSPTILVNNAGITRDSLAVRMTNDDWYKVIDTNLTAIFRISRSVLKNMIKARWGRIINVTSVVGFSGNSGQVNYAAAKSGITGMSRALAKELGSRNITVNCVAPGFIETDMTHHSMSKKQIESLLEKIPLGRLGNTNDVAKAVAFLASPNAGYITGTTLHINGGIYM